MTTVAPKPIVTRPWPVHQPARGSAFARLLRTTDAKQIGLLYLVTILTLVATGLGWASDDPVALAVQLPAGLTLLIIPVVTTIAILRHHIFDIDIIIRRTLIYSTLTITLGWCTWAAFCSVARSSHPISAVQNSRLWPRRWRLRRCSTR